MAFTIFCLAIALVAFAAPSLQQKDPLKDFCRRWGHQTAVIDRRLYIDGGQVTWNPQSQNPLNYTNSWLLFSDLNATTADGGMPLQYANLTKNATIPSVSGGVLWADDVNKVFYQFGGEFQNDPEAFSFWAYDTLLNQWNATNAKTNNVQRVSFGAGTAVDELGYGFYYGGWLNSHTIPGWNGPPIATSNLIKYDMNANTFTNNTGPDNVGRAEGQMLYLPASDNGILVYFGGVESTSNNGSTVGANMSSIHVFDIASSKWYTQTATGQIPPSRRRFCAGATWADDHSSYNIYLYGGNGIENVTGFDDSYVLSIPSFQWIKLWPTDNSNGTNPHGSLTCNMISNSQMLIMGGWFSQNSDCDSPNVWGQHNMNVGETGPQNALWDKYYPNITKYFVPTPVISSIGGGPTGGATATKPSGGWGAPDLSVYFTRVPTFAARTPTRAITTATSNPSGGSHSHVGAIAGGVVGGLAGIALILGLLLFCLHRAKKNRKSKPDEPKPIPPQELPANSPTQGPIHELASPGVAKWQQQQQYSPNTQHSPGHYDLVPTHSRSPSGQAVLPDYPPGAYGHSPPTSHPGLYQGPYQDYPQSQYPQSAYPTFTTDGSYPTPTSAHQRHYSDPSSPEFTQHPWPKPSHSPQNPPYNPVQHPINQQYFPPPPQPGVGDPRLGSPASSSGQPSSTSNTPAHFYPQPLNVQPRSESPRQGSFRGSLGTGGRGTPDRRPIHGRFIEEDY